VETYCCDVFGAVVVQFVQYYIDALLSMTDAFIFQCSSSNSGGGGGLGAIVCHRQFTIVTRFLVLWFVRSYNTLHTESYW
jgi:hypothetical protein